MEKRLTVREAVAWLKENVGDDLTIAFSNDYDFKKEVVLNMRDEKFKIFLSEMGGLKANGVYHANARMFNLYDLASGISKPRVTRKKIWTITYTLLDVDFGD